MALASAVCGCGGGSDDIPEEKEEEERVSMEETELDELGNMLELRC